MSQPPVQLQLDLVTTAVISTTVIRILLEACAEDNIQPIVAFPLEAFGSFLLVELELIKKGGKALEKTNNKLVSLVKMVIGLSDRGLTRAVRENINLTAAFLFAVACSTTFSVEEVGNLIFEMMALKGILASYAIHSAPISQFVRLVIGHGDLMEGQSPLELYGKLAKIITQKLNNADAFPGLFDTSPVNKLAKILLKVFEELQNADNRCVTMEGWRTGLWLATVFIWLRPNETDLSLDGYRIYPEVGNGEVRLSINLVRRPNRGDISQWRIHSWRQEEDLEKIVESMDDMIKDLQPHYHYPLSVAREQMANSGANNLLLDETGYIAAALVDVAFEEGHFCNKEGSSSLPLQDICSDYFLNSQHNIMENFGWKLDNGRQNKIAEALKDQFRKARNRGRLASQKDDVEAILSEIDACNKIYHDTHGEPLVTMDDSRLSDATERAIYLAVEALFFSFCYKRPTRELYRPLTTDKLRSHARIIRKLLLGPVITPPGVPPRIRGYPFWEFRAQAIQSLLEGVADVDSSDLAIASNGYVAFSAALLEMNKDMTDRRKISSICIVPGALRLEGEPGRFDKIVEAKHKIVLASRLLCVKPHSIDLFSSDSQFRGLDDREALDKLGTKIEHLTSSSDDSLRRRVVYLTTFLYPVSEGGASPLLLLPGQAEPPVATSWNQSIDAISFATHVSRHNMAPAQERSLAKRWWEKGYIEPNNFLWCFVGHAAGHSKRYISTTSTNEQLRFFEAGNLQDGRKLFIRQKYVPLMQCIKEAMEICEADANWAIIS